MAAAAIAALMALTPVQSASPMITAAQIPASQQAFASCVSARESHGNYKAKRSEAGSSAAGRWQFLDKQWRRGLSYMVAERLRSFGMSTHEAAVIRRHLAATRIDRWAPEYQDAAFLAALNARGPWSGWRHWYLAGSKCNALVPIGAR
jgi:hypothetical protein